MSEHNLILEFYKPTYNLDFDYDGNGGLDLYFTNIKGEFFMTMNDSYNSVYIEDEDCEFSKGEMFATVDLGDLVERIINGEFRQTNGKAINDWSKRFIGDGEEQIEFNGKNYADGSLFWDDFFKEMPKDEIKDFMTFCEDYLDLPNIELDTVSDKYYFENGKVELKSNGKWGITVNDDYTIISVDKFTCNSTDACDAYDVASSESDEDDFYESKKSVKRSLKEEKVTDSLFQNVVFSMIKKFKLKKEYDVERPSWSVFNFRHKNKDAQFAITFDERGHGDFLYGEVLAFGDEKDDIFKYKTDEVKVDSYNIEKECSNIIADCLAFIDANKKITIFESKKSARKNLKEGISAFNKAIAKKYNETEPNSAGQYYLDWRFDLQDEKDNIEAIADRCGVTVEFQSDEGYFEVFEESKKSAKTMNEKISPKYVYNFKNDGDYMISMFDDYNFEILAIPDGKSLFSKDLPKFKIEKTYIYEQYNDDIWLFVGEVEELGWCFIAFDKDSNNSNVYAYQYGDNKNYAYIPFHSYISYLENKKVYRTHNAESKKSAKKSLKESTDESFSLYDLNKHDPFVKEWIRNINKELRDVSIESIGDDEIIFRVWFDETMDLDIFDDIVTDCMPSILIEFMSDMNIDFNYQFVYADDKFTENDYVFIRFVAW